MKRVNERIIMVAFSLWAMLCNQVFSQTYDTTLFNSTNTPVLTATSFKAATVGKGNNVYIGSTNQGLYRFNGSSWSKLPVLTTHNIRALASSPVDSTIWVAHTGTGNQGTSQYTNGGVHHILDTTTFAFTYYGAIAGLPTRGGYGIGVTGSNIAWSAHITQLTSGVTAGGGIGKMISGSATASSLYLGLPSGNWASDVRCLSMGVGPEEFWVGVDRSCYNGNCRKAYVARYTLAGGFVDSIAASNSPIPFTNVPGGPTVRAIDFDTAGRGWLGLSSGGVWVDDNGTWTQVPSAVFPTGATVNYQSITHENDGTVYIGTSIGLLIYYGGSLTDPDSYGYFYPNLNIAGVAVDQDGNIWLATTTGIIKMFQTSENSIEGNIFRTRINTMTGIQENEPYPFCKVYLYENAQLSDSVNASIAGYFKFSELDTANTYDLLIKGGDPLASNISVNCTIPDADIGIPYTQILIPYYMHIDIVENLAYMEADTFAWSYLFGAVNIDTITINAYNISAMANYEFNHRNFTIDEDNPNEKQIELIGRLLIQTHLLRHNKEYAAKMAALLTKEACDIGFILFDISKKSKLPAYNLVALLANAVNKRFQNTVKGLINKSCDFIDDPTVRNISKQQLNAAYDAVSNFVEEYSTTNAGWASLTTIVVKELVGNLVANTLTFGVHYKHYVQETKQVLPQAMTGLGTYPFAQPLESVAAANIAFQNTTSRTRLVFNNYNSTYNQITTINALSGISSATTNLLDYGTVIAALTCPFTAGLGCAAAATMKTTAKILKGLNFAGKALNVGRTAKFVYDTRTNTNTSAGSIFDQSVVQWPFKAQASASGLQNQTTDYNQKINKIGAFLQAGNRDSVLAMVTPLIQADSLTTNSMLNLSKVVFSASPAAYQADTTFADFLSMNFVNRSMNASMGREAFNYLMISYIIDSVTNYADTLIQVIPEVIQTNNDAVALYDSLINAMSGLPLSQRLMVALSLEGNCNIGSTYPVTVEVQNISNSAVAGAYVLIEATGGVSTTPDSIFIGTIPGGQMVTVTFTANTPLTDTTAQIMVMAGSAYGEEDADGGSMNISGIGTNVNVGNVTVENGMSDCFNALQTLTIAGNGTSFVVQPGGQAMLIAGQKILIKPGTRVFSGGTMNAHITSTNQYCVPYIPDNRTIPSTTLSGNQTMCYDAIQTITTGGSGSNFIVPNGCHAELIAGMKINLKPGTKVLQGGYLKARISADGQYCGAKSASDTEVEKEEPLANSTGPAYKVYPNPARDHVVIESLHGSGQSTVEIVIYSMMGEMIRSEKFGPAKTYRLHLETGHSGLYLLRIVSGSHAEIHKIIRL